MQGDRFMNRQRLSSALAAFGLAMAAHGQIVFSESFEVPVVSGYAENTVPAAKWVGSTAGFGAGSRGLYNEFVAWPAVPRFTTPYGDQGYLIDYTNAGLTTSQNAIPGVLTADVTYTVTFNAAVLSGAAAATYQVELVAFAASVSNSVRQDCQASRPGTILATATGPVATNDMSVRRSFSYTVAATNAHIGKEIGLRLIKNSGSVLYDNLRLIAGTDPDPRPEDGVTIAGGSIQLQWANLPPVTGTDTYVDVWFGTNTATWTRIVGGGLNVTSATVNAPVAATYLWRIDSYLNGSTNGAASTGTVFRFHVTDTDGDGFPDSYELAHTTPVSNTALNPGDDLDADSLTNMQEYQYGTDPNDADTDNDTLLDGPELTGVGLRPPTSPLKADTDGDGLSDSAESNSGTWVSPSDPGTNPAEPDSDNDGLKDGVENNTGLFVNKSQTGTNPFLADTDGDGEGDWYEVAAVFTDPNNPAAKGPLPYPLPKPDLTPTATNKRVKVFILSGQSNMVGMGDLDPAASPGSLNWVVKTESKFTNLLTTNGTWARRNDVLYRGVISAIGNTNLTVGQGADSGSIGPELGFGHVMGHYFDEPVLLIKASIGNRSIGWDYLPPGSATFTNGGTVYAGYGDLYASWPVGSPPTNAPNWYAGKQYDECFLHEADWSPSAATIGASAVTNVVDVLDNFATQYPQWAAQDFEIAGFVWFQGNKDILAGAPNTTNYETNLVRLIQQLRLYYQNRYPTRIRTDAPFVIATGCGDPQTNGNGLVVANAQLALNDTNKHPAFAGNVKTMDIRPYWRGVDESPVAQGYHYNRNAETYLLIGDALGRGMMELLDEGGPDTNGPVVATYSPTDGATNVARGANLVAVFNEAIAAGTGNITLKNLTDATQTSIAITDGSQVTATGVVLTINPAADLGPGKAYAVQIDPAALVDMATNAYAGIATDTMWNFWTAPLDTTPPSLTLRSPADGATNVALAANLVATFSEPVFAGSGNVTLKNLTDATQVTIAITDGAQISIAGTVVTVNPAVDLLIGRDYAVRIDAGALVDAATNGFAGIADDTTWNFTTVPPDTTPPSLILVNPADGATNVSPSANLVATFSEPVAVGAGNVTLKSLTDATEVTIPVTDGAQVSVAGAVLTINPAANLAVSKDYAVRIDAGAILDLVTNSFAGIADDTTWNFTSAPYGLGTARSWDGGTNDLAGTGDGASAGGPGVWNTATTNWDQGSGLDRVAWANGNNDTALFGGTVGTVTVAEAVTVGGLSFAVNNYLIASNVVTFGAPGAIAVSNGVTATISSQLAGGWPITKTGPGTLLLAGANTHSGGTVVAAGTIGNINSSSFGAGPVTVTGNASLTPPYNVTPTLSNSLTVNPGVTVSLLNGNQFQNMTFSTNAPLAGSGQVVMLTGLGGAAGTLRFTSASNTFTGTLQITNSGNGNGVLSVNSLPDSPNPVRLSGTANPGIFELGSGTATPLLFDNRHVELNGTVGGILQNNNGTASNTIVINTPLRVLTTGAKTLTLQGSNAGTNLFAGSITNGANAVVSLAKAGTGVWNVTGTNSFTGTTTINGGTLAIDSIASVNGGPSALGAPTNVAGGTIALGSGTTAATLRYRGAGDTSDRVLNLAGTTGGAEINHQGSGLLKFTSALTASGVGNKGLTFSGPAGTTGEVAGAIVDSSASTTTSVAKVGAGTWILSGASVYRGATTITGGTLVVHGSLLTNGPLFVRTAGRLSGTGTVGIVANNGTVAPGGDAPGLLTFAGGYTQTNGTLSLRIGAGAGDGLLVGGVATLGGTVNVSLVSTPTPGSSFTLVAAPSVSGAFAVTNLPALPSGSGWSVANLATAVVLSVTGAPPDSGYAAFSNVHALANGPDGDDDGDGFANLYEYVTGSNPTNGGSNAGLGAARTNGQFALRFTRDTNTVDATLVVEGAYAPANDAAWIGFATNSNGSWGAATNVVEGTGNPASVTVFDSEPAATNRFLRLRITRP